MMNVTYTISLAGVNHPNLIQELSKFTNQQQGKWVSSRVSYLDGHIAANIKVESPPENKDAIISYFQNQEKINCYIDEDTAPHSTENIPVTSLTIKSGDKSGLVSDITHVVNQQNAELLHIVNHRYSVPPLGTNVFTAEIDVKVDPDLTVEDLIKELKTITEDMVVTLES